MIVAQTDADGGITTLWRLKEPVGLGRMSFPSRRLGAEAMDRAIKVLERFKQQAHQRQSEKIIAVATSAIREATNGGDFIELARRELGMSIKVVSAREEARLIYLAVRHTMHLKSQPHLIIDIGGGSVEFIVGDQKLPNYSRAASSRGPHDGDVCEIRSDQRSRSRGFAGSLRHGTDAHLPRD